MPLAVLVIDRDAPLEKPAQRRRVERVGNLRIVERFGLVEQEPPIAIGAGDQRIARFGREGEGPLERLAAVEQLAQRLVIQPLEDQHLRAAEQCRIEREAGVFGRCAHQRHRAAFDKGQEAILLRTVEAVDLVHEQQRALTGLRGLVGSGEGLLEVGHAAEYRADAFEAHPHAIGEQPRDGGLAGAGRPPEDHARQAAGGDHSPDRAFGPGQMVLPDHLVEGCGTQPVGQRRILARSVGCSCLGQVVGKEVGHWSADIGCSPRICSALLQTRL